MAKLLVTSSRVSHPLGFLGADRLSTYHLLDVNTSTLEPERWTIVCELSPCSNYLFARISRFRSKDRRDLEADGNRDRNLWSLSTHCRGKNSDGLWIEEVD